MLEDKIKLVPIPDEKLKHYLKTSKGLGIIKQMMGEAKIIGYEYYLQVGFEQVFFVGSSKQAKILYNLYKQYEQ